MYTSSRGYQLADADCDRLRGAISRAQRSYCDGFMESIDWQVIDRAAAGLVEGSRTAFRPQKG